MGKRCSNNVFFCNFNSHHRSLKKSLSKHGSKDAALSVIVTSCSRVKRRSLSIALRPCPGFRVPMVMVFLCWNCGLLVNCFSGWSVSSWSSPQQQQRQTPSCTAALRLPLCQKRQHPRKSLSRCFRDIGFDSHDDENSNCRESNLNHEANQTKSLLVRVDKKKTAGVVERRRFLTGIIVGGSVSGACLLPHKTTAASASASSELKYCMTTSGGGKLYEIVDPATYSAVVYLPPVPPQSSNAPKRRYPVLLVLHGAARNDKKSAWKALSKSFQQGGEHAGLPISLLAASAGSYTAAPTVLQEEFIVVCPYVGFHRTSFLNEPRSKLLQFIRWFINHDSFGLENAQIDSNNIFVLGFSDGATVSIELATTRLFRAAVIASYGYTGTLPALALERLRGIPVWVFHSADDVIFPVAYSDRLVASLQSANAGGVHATDSDHDMVRYSRFDSDPEKFPVSVRGHTTGITASKDPAVYQWLISHVVV